MDEIALKLSITWTRDGKGPVAPPVLGMHPRNMPVINNPLFGVFGLPFGPETPERFVLL
jgi:hypothetical protein